MSHGVHDAQAHIGEAHAGHILAQSHALTTLVGVSNGTAQAIRDDLDGLDVEHIAHFPCTLGDVALDGVGQSIHAGGGS